MQTRERLGGEAAAESDEERPGDLEDDCGLLRTRGPHRQVGVDPVAGELERDPLHRLDGENDEVSGHLGLAEEARRAGADDLPARTRREAAAISSKTSVSPPATAAIASAMRESSPPDAVSATGANGMPAFGRTRKTASSPPVAPCSRSCSSQTNSPSPMPMSCSSAATASA